MTAPDMKQRFTDLNCDGEHSIGEHKIRVWMFDEPSGIASKYLYQPDRYHDFGDSYELAETLNRMGFNNSIIAIVGIDGLYSVHVGDSESADKLRSPADIILNPIGDILRGPEEVLTALPARDKSWPPFSEGYKKLMGEGRVHLDRFRREKEWREENYYRFAVN